MDLVSRVTTIVAVVDKATAVLRAIEGRLGSLGRAASTVASKFRGIAERSGLHRLTGLLSNLSTRAWGAAKAFGAMLLPILGLGAGGGVVAGILSIHKALDTFIESGKRLNFVHEQLGITVERLQDLHHWGMLAEVPAEALDAGLGKLNRTLAQVAAGKNKEAAKLLGFVGISARDARGHVRSAADVMPQLANVFARIQNPAQRARLAVALFGKSGQLLIPMLAQGARGLAAATRELDRMGRMTQKEAELADELDDAQQRLHVVIGRVAQIVGAKMAPYVLKVVTLLREWIIQNRRMIELRVTEWVDRAATAIGKWWQQLQAVEWRTWLESLKQTAKYLGSWVDLLGGVSTLLVAFMALLVVGPVLKFAAALVTVSPALWSIAGALTVIEAPVWIVIGLLTLGAILVIKYWKQIHAWAKKPIDWSGLTKPLATAWDRIRSLFEDGRDAIARTLTDIVDRFARAWDRIASNPILRLLGGIVPGLGGAPLALPPALVPAPALPAPPAPGGPAPGPYRGGYVFPGGGPGGGGAVDVNVNFNNTPPGTQADATSKGTGVRTTTRVGYSMPQTRRGR